ncbi:hypothetical protein HMPREF0201_04774 [Cedecea davisae DSM 4568]|uniref:Uncharacterized protein n=1 Tax=Cedecea davisae DSM 4568 TaxID=566551 RepID=S3JHP3_9ENTR|nr:hypothetical protein HMPREF0201_04774 [Cedecea davisae DSM 4568]
MKQHFANRVMIILRRPQQNAPQRRGEQRNAVEYIGDRLELLKRKIAVIADGHNYADSLALLAKWHLHAAADIDLHARGKQIIEGAGQRNRQGDMGYGHESVQAEKNDVLVYTVCLQKCGSVCTGRLISV